MSTIAPTLLANLLARMRRQRGTIELQIIDGSASDLQDQLLGGQIAAAIYCKPEQRADARLNRIPMFREQMQIALPRTHRLAGQSKIHISDLAGEPYVRRTRCEFNELMGRLLGQHRISCDVSISSESDDWALALIARGAGLALFPQHSIKHPEVVARPLAEPDLWREVHLVTLRERAPSEALAFFLETATSRAPLEPRDDPG